MRPAVLIAQISDLHIKHPGELAYGKVDTAAALHRCVVELNRLNPRPQLVVISGDLVDTPNAEEYEHLKALLGPLEIPFVAVPGNHDDRTMMRAALPKVRYAQAEGALNSAYAIDGLDLILLDSSVPRKPHGELDQITLQWLELTLGKSTSQPAIIFLHHPPFATGIDHMDVQNLRNASSLGEILLRHPRARLVAAGHVHRAALAQFAGAPATICPAPSHAVALDLNGALPPAFQVEPPAFHLHAFFPGPGFGALVTHYVQIGDFFGPFPFFGTDGRLL
jgi:3',5'-cyclic AMP phosphodiesterase CpdA